MSETEDKMERVRISDKETMRTFTDALAAKYGDLTALSKYGDPDSRVSYAELPRYARSIGSYLIKLGLDKGDKVIILADSCPNWALAYLGITYCAMTVVSILPAFSKEEVEKIARHSDAKAVFANSANIDKTEGFGLPVIRLDDLHAVSDGTDAGHMPFSAFYSEEIERRIPDCHDVASIIYTSGTTGEPKGVMLTHRNLLWNAEACVEPFIRIRRGWRVFSILPMAHVYEFTVGLLLVMIPGCHITYFARPMAVTQLLKAFSEVRPHICLTVPMLIEKVYNKAVAPKIKAGTKAGRMLRIPVVRAFVYRTIGRKLRATFGGSIRFFGVGGAPLDLEVETFLHKARFPYALGYGMTETSPMIAGCGPSYQSPGSLGPAVKGVEVKIAPRTNEIIVRSPSVMKGYYKNPELTAQVLSEDGWMSTGDTGYFTKDNRLVLNGRIKEMILTSSGENIFPEAIESMLNRMDFVEESLIIPEDGNLVALIKLNVEELASSLKITATEAKERALSYIQELREAVNKKLPSTSRISKAEIQETPFERTPTAKIKRAAVINNRRKAR